MLATDDKERVSAVFPYNGIMRMTVRSFERSHKLLEILRLSV
jgi:hypothetical protein